MQTIYVSLTGDLLHHYLEYQAESREALEDYLERTYKKNGEWTLPWCAMYTREEISEDAAFVIIQARVGNVFARGEAPRKALTPRQVIIDATGYQRAHQRRPRPSQYGLWAFGPKVNTPTEEMFWLSGTLAEAREPARKWAAAQGHATIYIQS
jgi:hypothetical protein